MIVTVGYGKLRAMSTVGTLTGTNDEGERVTFAADHREARAMIEALYAGEAVEVDVPEWAILKIEE